MRAFAPRDAFRDFRPASPLFPAAFKARPPQRLSLLNWFSWEYAQKKATDSAMAFFIELERPYSAATGSIDANRPRLPPSPHFTRPVTLANSVSSDPMPT